MNVLSDPYSQIRSHVAHANILVANFAQAQGSVWRPDKLQDHPDNQNASQKGTGNLWTWNITTEMVDNSEILYVSRRRKHIRKK